jgi:hypothetical protein
MAGAERRQKSATVIPSIPGAPLFAFTRLSWPAARLCGFASPFPCAVAPWQSTLGRGFDFAALRLCGVASRVASSRLRDSRGIPDQGSPRSCFALEGLHGCRASPALRAALRAGYVRCAPITAAGAPNPVSPTGVIDGLVSGGVDPLLIGSALHRVNATARQRSQSRGALPRSRQMSAILRLDVAALHPPGCPAGSLSPCGRFAVWTGIFQPPARSLDYRAAAAMASADFPPPGGGGICLAALALRAAFGSLSPLRSDSPSLPSPSWLPFPSWPQMVVSHIFMFPVSPAIATLFTKLNESSMLPAAP